MSKGKLAGIIVACTIAIIVVIVLVMPPLLQAPTATPTPTPTHTLSVSVSPSGAGSVSPSGGEYESGVQITLTASPASGYNFAHWSGRVSGTTSTITVTMDSDKSVTANFEAISTVSVTYEAVVLFAHGYLRVRVEGPQNNYSIILFDPEGESVGYGYISHDDMLTGHKTVDVSMTNIDVRNPVSGEYWLIVKESWTDETVFEAKPVFQGPHVSITDVQFETEYSEYIGGSVDEVIVQVYNGGDLPIFPDEMRLLVAGEQNDITIYESLPHGETTVIEHYAFISGLERGTHPVMVEIYSEGVKLASYETQVRIG